MALTRAWPLVRNSSSLKDLEFSWYPSSVVIGFIQRFGLTNFMCELLSIWCCWEDYIYIETLSFCGEVFGWRLDSIIGKILELVFGGSYKPSFFHFFLSFLCAPWHPTCYKCRCVGNKKGARVCARSQVEDSFSLGDSSTLLDLALGVKS